MTPRDFCYWLQGFFELAPPTVLSRSTVECIAAHLNVVRESCGGALPDGSFVGWLSSALDVALALDVEPLEARFVGLVRQRLDSTFKHVIDPNTPGDQNKMNHLHHGQSPGAVTMRC